MVERDLTKLKLGSLTLRFDGHVYIVPPPSAENGELLGKCMALGLGAIVNKEAITEELIVEQLGKFAEENDEQGRDSSSAISRLALSDSVYDQMWADGLPLPDIQSLARYASWFWIFGREAADKLLEDPDMQVPVVDEFPKVSKSGPNTESVNPSPAAADGTPATTSRPTYAASSGNRKTRRTATQSRGKKSTKIGR